MRIYRDAPEPEVPEKLCCLGWYGEAQRAMLLLETLAEDHFADQDAFDKWIHDQQEKNLRDSGTGGEKE